jgi:HlyD family secretion protein
MYGQMEKSYTGGMRQYYNAQIDAAKLTIAQLEERSGKAEIRAAVSGTVESLPIENQNMAAQQQPAAVISAHPYVEAYVPVREIDSVAVGMSVELILDKRLGEEIVTGKVVEIDDEAEIKLSPLGVEERKVRVLITPDENRLKIGYSADARFTVWERENALTVPKTAVFSADGGDCVWAVREGKLRRVPIEKGVELRDAYVILSGLTEGGVVVLDADNEALAEGKAFSAINP